MDTKRAKAKCNSNIKAQFASINVLFTRKEVKGYSWFESRVLQRRGGEDIPVNSKYPLPSK